jgi:hypothetical protein
MELEKTFNLIIVAIAIIYTAFMFKFLFNMEEQYGTNGQAKSSVNNVVGIEAQNVTKYILEPKLTNLSEVYTSNDPAHHIAIR